MTTAPGMSHHNPPPPTVTAATPTMTVYGGSCHWARIAATTQNHGPASTMFSCELLIVCLGEKDLNGKRGVQSRAG